MEDQTLILVALMTGLLAATSWASTSGLGLAQPEPQPPSIREGSVRALGSGRVRTRYFVGGGHHAGK